MLLKPRPLCSSLDNDILVLVLGDKPPLKKQLGDEFDIKWLFVYQRILLSTIKISPFLPGIGWGPIARSIAMGSEGMELFFKIFTGAAGVEDPTYRFR